MKNANLPAALGTIEEVDERFQRWRRGRPRGSKIPDELWATAAALAREQGVNRIAQALRLNYYDLKKRLEATQAAPCAQQAAPSFVEWLAPAGIGSSECRVELENRRGAKMRIELKGGEIAASLERLSHSFWSAR